MAQSAPDEEALAGQIQACESLVELETILTGREEPLSRQLSLLLSSKLDKLGARQAGELGAGVPDSLKQESTLSSLLCRSAASLSERSLRSSSRFTDVVSHRDYVDRLRAALQRPAMRAGAVGPSRPVGQPGGPAQGLSGPSGLSGLAGLIDPRHPALLSLIHLPPVCAASYYASYLAYGTLHGVELPQRKKKPDRVKIDRTQIQTRERYVAPTMNGAAEQETRKNELLSRIWKLCVKRTSSLSADILKNVSTELRSSDPGESADGPNEDFALIPYPLLFLGIHPRDLTKTVHTLFDLSQLFADGEISVRDYAPSRAETWYAAHGIRPRRRDGSPMEVGEAELDSLFVIPRPDGPELPGSGCFPLEFTPKAWKSLSALLTLTEPRVRKMADRYGLW